MICYSLPHYPKENKPPRRGGLQIQEILMVRLVFAAGLHQRGKGALHPFLHGGHGLRVPLQAQQEASVRSFNALHNSRRAEGADPHSRAGVSTA